MSLAHSLLEGIEYGCWLATLVEGSLLVSTPSQCGIVGRFPVVIYLWFPLEETLAGRDGLATIHHLLHHWGCLIGIPIHTNLGDNHIAVILV